MKNSDVICLNWWLKAILFVYFQLAGCEQQILSEQGRLRNATADDAGNVTAVIIAAFSPLPYWKYVFQFREEYPEEHAQCLRAGIQKLLQENSTHAEVIEAPSDHDLSISAVAIWTRKSSSDPDSLHFMSTKCLHRDLNITRGIDFDNKFTTGKRKYVDERFGLDQLYLDYLATHPRYQSRGEGTRLVTRGLQRAEREHINTTLIAQVTAETFYMHLGFTSMTNISIKSVDKDQTFRFPVMVHNPGNGSGQTKYYADSSRDVTSVVPCRVQL